ncbi:MAG TPA: S1 RNA-binding domain-containing protein [Tepidisphaeraceae bacterium]|nr:S1 RNA-binding domain-containing protein [Tepidisphaeraceae bacterium]
MPVKKGDFVKGHVVKSIPGSLVVDIGDGKLAYLPDDQIDLKPVENKLAWIDRDVKCVVMSVSETERVVISRWLAQQKDQEAQGGDHSKDLTVGTHINGKVKQIASFGVIVDLGREMQGLLHRTNISHRPLSIEELSKKFRPGDDIQVVISEVKPDKKIRFSLESSHLQDEWSAFKQQCPIGSKHSVKVTKVAPFGLYTKLNDFKQFVHQSKMNDRKASEFGKGDEISVEVVGIDDDQKRVELRLSE